MSDTVKVVVEIPKETYLEIRSGFITRNAIEAAEAIKNGTPLPKGHGRLIDADEIIEQANNMADELDNDYTIADIEKVGTLLESVSTIIEADKENE